MQRFVYRPHMTYMGRFFFEFELQYSVKPQIDRGYVYLMNYCTQQRVRREGCLG